MRGASAIVALCLILSGCAVVSERQSLGYGDYVGFSCDQLGQEAVRLMRQTANRSEHILENDQARRDSALRQLKAVKQASTDKRC
ncbi:MAG TPA: hypothetical protein VIG38_08880 [Hyphomicrobium sp.]